MYNYFRRSSNHIYSSSKNHRNPYYPHSLSTISQSHMSSLKNRVFRLITMSHYYNWRCYQSVKQKKKSSGTREDPIEIRVCAAGRTYRLAHQAANLAVCSPSVHSRCSSTRPWLCSRWLGLALKGLQLLANFHGKVHWGNSVLRGISIFPKYWWSLLESLFALLKSSLLRCTCSMGFSVYVGFRAQSKEH